MRLKSKSRNGVSLTEQAGSLTADNRDQTHARDTQPPLSAPGSAPPPNTEHVTLCELAQWARCSTRTIQRLLEVGTGPPVIHLSDRRIIFRVGDVRDWLERKRFQRRGIPNKVHLTTNTSTQTPKKANQ